VSEANIDLARQAFDAFAARDVEACVAVFSEDAEFLPVTANLTTGGIPYRGREGIARYFEDVGRVWDELRVFPTEFRDMGETVITLGRMYGRGGGMIIDRPTGWVWRFRDGKIVSGRVFASQEEALRDAGLGA
jgi:ketosteroid isomerase-like protein